MVQEVLTVEEEKTPLAGIINGKILGMYRMLLQPKVAMRQIIGVEVEDGQKIGKTSIQTMPTIVIVEISVLIGGDQIFVTGKEHTEKVLT